MLAVMRRKAVTCTINNVRELNLDLRIRYVSLTLALTSTLTQWKGQKRCTFSLTFSKPKLGSNVVGGVTRQVINHLLHEMQILTSNSSGDPAPPESISKYRTWRQFLRSKFRFLVIFALQLKPSTIGEFTPHGPAYYIHNGDGAISASRFSPHRDRERTRTLSLHLTAMPVHEIYATLVENVGSQLT
jgi:hypothetical protein